MPDPVRALLLEELRARGYRVKALEPAPPFESETRVLPLPRAQGRDRLIRRCVRLTLVFGVVQILAALYVGVNMERAPSDLQGFLLPVGLPVGVGLLFLGLFFWARSSPRPALWGSLLLFVLAQVGGGWIGVKVLYGGPLLRWIVLIGWGIGLVATGRAGDVREQPSGAPAESAKGS